MPSNSLVAIYDLRVCPETFDIVDFVSLAVNEALERRFECIEFLIYVPHEEQRKYANRFASTVSNLRIRNLLLQCLCSLQSELKHDLVLLQSPQALQEFLIERDPSSYYPEDYTFENPTCRHNVHYFIRLKDLPNIDCPEPMLKQAKAWLHSRNLNSDRLITLTLRESRVYPDRNVDTETWLQAATYLKNLGWDVLVIRDTALAFEPLPINDELHTCIEASLNIPFRAALYRNAKLNVQITGGPSTLCIANPNCTFLYLFKIVANCGAASQKGLLQDAFLPGSSWPEASKNRITFWETEATDALLASILFALNGESNSNNALTRSALNLQNEPPKESELEERVKQLLTHERVEEAALTRVHYQTNQSYRNTNQALAHLWSSLSQVEIRKLAGHQPRNSTGALTPLSAPFLSPTSIETWITALSHLFDCRQFDRAVQLTHALLVQQEQLTNPILEAWKEKLLNCIDSGERGTALENAISIRRKLGNTQSEELSNLIVDTLRENSSLSAFFDGIDITNSTLLDNFNAFQSSHIPKEEKLFLYGTGSGGKEGLELAESQGCQPYAFCQTSTPTESTFENVPIVSLQGSISIKRANYLICSQSYAADMILNLIASGIPSKRIFLSYPAK